jgi:hypothetical protein
MKGLIPKYQKGSALDIARMKSDFMANSNYVKNSNDGVAYLSKKGKEVLKAIKELEASHLEGQTYEYDPVTETYEVSNPVTGEISEDSGLNTDQSRINLHIFNKEKRQDHRLNKNISKLVPKYVTSRKAIEDLVETEPEKKESKKVEVETSEEKTDKKIEDPIVSLGLLNAMGATPFLSSVIPTPSILAAKEKDKKEKESLTAFLTKPKVESPKVKTKEEVKKEKEKAEKEKLKLTGSFGKDALNIKSVDYKTFNPTKKFKEGGQLVTKHQSRFGPTVIPDYNFGRPSFENNSKPIYTPFNKIQLTTTPTNLNYNYSNTNPFKKNSLSSNYDLLGNQKRFVGGLTGTDYNEQLLKFKAEESQKRNENLLTNTDPLNTGPKRGLINKSGNFNLNKLGNYIPLALNTVGNLGQYWGAMKASEDPVGYVKPSLILNSNRVAVQNVAPVQSSFEDFDKTAGAFRNTYAGSDPALSMLSGNIAQGQRQEVLFAKAKQEGIDSWKRKQDYTSAENLVRQAHAANLNSDTATLNANNDRITEATMKQLEEEAKRKEFRYKATGDFLSNTFAGIGNALEARRQFKVTKGMTDLALGSQNLQQMRATNAYLVSQGKAPMDISTYEQQYQTMDNEFKNKYGLT